jgi:hypothetical protein
MPRLAASKLPSAYWPSNENSALVLPTPVVGRHCMTRWWLEDEINMAEGGLWGFGYFVFNTTLVILVCPPIRKKRCSLVGCSLKIG